MFEFEERLCFRFALPFMIANHHLASWNLCFSELTHYFLKISENQHGEFHDMTLRDKFSRQFLALKNWDIRLQSQSPNVEEPFIPNQK
jgi:hypothetical protein